MGEGSIELSKNEDSARTTSYKIMAKSVSVEHMANNLIIKIHQQISRRKLYLYRKNQRRELYRRITNVMNVMTTNNRNQNNEKKKKKSHVTTNFPTNHVSVVMNPESHEFSRGPRPFHAESPSELVTSTSNSAYRLVPPSHPFHQNRISNAPSRSPTTLVTINASERSSHRRPRYDISILSFSGPQSEPDIRHFGGLVGE